MKIRPMLAKSYEDRYASYPAVLQPKLNGHRLIWDGKKLWSRNGKEIVSVPGIVFELKTHFDGYPLDGELFAEGYSFSDITRVGRRTKNITDDENLKMWVYDVPVAGKPSFQRLSMVENVNSKILKLGLNRIRVVPFKIVDKKLKNMNIYGKKYEGTMFRVMSDTKAEYKFGKRSSDLLKIKEFKDTEATVIGVVQLNTYEKIKVSENTPGSRRKSDGTYTKNGEATKQPKMGAFKCRLKNGVEFEIGSGFTDKERREFWKNRPIGKKVTFQYQELSDDGVPIFPTYLRMRQDI